MISASTRTDGCYSLHVTLKLLGNSAVAVSNAAGATPSLFFAADPGDGPAAIVRSPHDADLAQLWIGTSAFALLLAVAVAIAAQIGLRTRPSKVAQR